MFRGLPGYERVKRKSYNLIAQNSPDFIDASRWSTAVSPGAVVVMSIQVIVAVTEWELAAKDDTSNISCPRCQENIPQQRQSSARW
jgi:hypothetical protein